MEPSGISDQVRQLLQDHIASVAQLETLLLLQTNPGQKWTAGDIARELRTDTAGTRRQLDLLAQSGLLKVDETGGYYYAPASQELHASVIALAQAYLVRRVSIISLIFAKPSSDLRAFSDAFRLRKGPPQ